MLNFDHMCCTFIRQRDLVLFIRAGVAHSPLSTACNYTSIRDRARAQTLQLLFHFSVLTLSSERWGGSVLGEINSFSSSLEFLQSEWSLTTLEPKHLMIPKPQQTTLDWISELILQREQVWADCPGILHEQPRCPLAPPLTSDLTRVWVGFSWLKQAEKPLFVQPVCHACVMSTHGCAPTCHLYLNWDSPIPLDHLRAFLPPSAGLGQHAVGLACLRCLQRMQNLPRPVYSSVKSRLEARNRIETRGVTQT